MQINFGARIIEPFQSYLPPSYDEKVIYDIDGKEKSDQRIIRLNNDGLPHLDVYKALTDNGDRRAIRPAIWSEPSEEEAKAQAAISGVQDLFTQLPDEQLDKLVAGFSHYTALLQSRLGKAVERVLKQQDYPGYY